MTYKVMLPNGLETGHTSDREMGERTFHALAKVGRCMFAMTDKKGYHVTLAQSIKREIPDTLGDYENAVQYNRSYKCWTARPEYLI